jgi:hypothetical protein
MEPVRRSSLRDLRVDDAGFNYGQAQVGVQPQNPVQTVERDNDPARHRQRSTR